MSDVIDVGGGTTAPLAALCHPRAEKRKTTLAPPTKRTVHALF